MPHEQPFRLRVMMALTDTLNAISVVNGYKHDLEGHVFRGRTIFGESDQLPLISILETPQPIDQISSPEFSVASTGDWDLLVQGFMEDDPNHPTDPAYRLVADVMQALARQRKRMLPGNRGQDILGMGGLVDRIDIGSPVVRPADENSAVSYFWLRVTLHIVEDMEKPYE